jgi:hypothetical protein
MEFMKLFATLAFLSALSLCSIKATDNTTIYYPEEKDAYFSITAPDDWELTPASEEGGFFDLNGPTGITLSFRALPAESSSMAETIIKGALAEADEFLAEYFTDIKVADAEEHTLNGLTGFRLIGSGKDKTTGEDSVFGLAYYALENGSVGEIWFSTVDGDSEGAEAADKIINTFKAE